MKFYNILVTCQNYDYERFTYNRKEAVKIYKNEINYNKDNPYKPVIIELQYLTAKKEYIAAQTTIQ